MLVCVSTRMAQLNSGGGGGEFESLADWNFVTGTYTTFGNSVGAAACVDQTGWITGDGLEIPGSAGAGAEMLNEVATYLFDCDFVVAFEYEILSTINNPRHYLMTVTNAGEAFFIEIEGRRNLIQDFDGVDMRGAWRAEPPGPSGVGIHKAAYRRVQSPAPSSVSVNGGETVNSTTANGFSFDDSVQLPVGGFPMVNAYLGGYSSFTGSAINIRRFQLYSSADVAGADLPSISAL